MKKARRLKRNMELSYMKETTFRTFSFLFPQKERYNIDVNRVFLPVEKTKPQNIPPNLVKKVVE